jgi:hypothetical protein
MRLVRLVYICILIIHLLMLALGGNAQGLPGFRLMMSKHPTDSKISKVKEIYTSQIGVREKQMNAGPEVETYLRYVNLPKGNPWCAAFVCWTLGKAGIVNPRTGWSPALFPAERVIWENKGKGGSSARPAAGRIADVFGLYFPEKGRIAHVGFIDEWNEPWVTTVEGNTNALGSREGDGVYRKRRLVRSVYQVARYTD